MREQFVEFIQTKITERQFINPIAFTFTPEKGWSLLQRLCFWVLGKIGCQKVETAQEFERVVLDLNKISEKIMCQHEEILNFYNYHRADRLLIGADDFRELQATPLFDQIVSFSIPNGPRCTAFKLMGMKVTVVPWMRGVLVLPELD
jgi:hypothetical protein